MTGDTNYKTVPTQPKLTCQIDRTSDNYDSSACVTQNRGRDTVRGGNRGQENWNQWTVAGIGDYWILTRDKKYNVLRTIIWRCGYDLDNYCITW